MYSGIDGREMSVQMFFGIVHYQRLRHMVSDKWQVIILHVTVLLVVTARDRLAAVSSRAIFFVRRLDRRVLETF